MSLWSALRGLFGGQKSGYALVWREQSAEGAIMQGESMPAKTDALAISDVRAKFMHAGADWAFWILFRPDDTLVTAERGPAFPKWAGDFAHITKDSHVRHTLESVRRHGGPVHRPLHSVRLKRFGRPAAPDKGSSDTAPSRD